MCGNYSEKISETLELSNCVVLTPEGIGDRQTKAISVLLQEVYKRTGINMPVVNKRPQGGIPVIAVADASYFTEEFEPLLKDLAGLEEPGREGYRIAVKSGSDPGIIVLGADPRGMLFGIGKLLRNLIMTGNSIKIAKDFKISSTPRYPIRGHQLGYRPKTNAYDAWSVEQFEQYIRELALFGANSIEILPPRTDDDDIGPHTKVPPMEMMCKLSEILDSYGLDVWVWYPNMGKDYTDEETVRFELAEREEIFRKLPRIDAIFIPGGDPGDLHPDVLFEWCHKVYEVLIKYHPKAKIWLSPQAFKPTKSWIEAFYRNTFEEPEWLGGIVFGPWIKVSLPELRKIIPEKYPIRLYPDITHSLRCQYPVPNWDLAFALTLGRECINPRPNAIKHIHNMFQNYAIGNISYSEGINDDVNKFILSDQDWDPDTAVIDTLRDYAGLFIDITKADDIAQGIMALEENFEGHLIHNEKVEQTLRQWLTLEKEVSDQAANNYRFQMCLLRACFDAYVRRRLIFETEKEMQALDIIKDLRPSEIFDAIRRAREILKAPFNDQYAVNLKKKCEFLADELFKNIGEQLTVGRHKAIAWHRGAFMDTIDVPLNNSGWLFAQFDKIEKIQNVEEAFKEAQEIINYSDPGPGGFYDNLGSPESWKRVCNRKDWKEDPGNFSSPLVGFPIHIYDKNNFSLYGIPASWLNNITTNYDTPLTVLYENIDPSCDYLVRVKYMTRGGSAGGGNVKMTVNDTYVVHDYYKVFDEAPPVEYIIPREVLSSGCMKITWTTLETDQGPHVAEIWIKKKRKN